MTKKQNLSDFPSYIDVEQDVKDILDSGVIPEFSQAKDDLVKIPEFLNNINIDFDKNGTLDSSLEEYKNLPSKHFKDLLNTFNALVKEVDEKFWKSYTKKIQKKEKKKVKTV